MKPVISFLALLLSLLLSGCASTPKATDTSEKVDRAIQEATRSGSIMQRSFDTLQMLGDASVPYVVGNLGDVQGVPEGGFLIRNRSAGAFEQVRHFSPETVHDGLAAILSQMTGQSFIFVYNGSTPADRHQNRLMWVDWCQVEYPNQVAACQGKGL